MARFSIPMSSKGQITIPIDIRNRNGFSPADRFEIIEQDDGIFLRPAKSNFVDLAGRVPTLKGREKNDLETIIKRRVMIKLLKSAGDLRRNDPS